MSRRRAVFRLILILFVVKIFLAFLLEFNNDEAYYWTYAHPLQWNYFDHPPMIGILIKIFTWNQAWHHEFFARLPVMLANCGSLWMMYLVGKKTGGEKSGWLATCLLACTVYGNILAGLFILPDGPQLFFWLSSVYLLQFIVSPETGTKKKNIFLLLLGICIALCTLSKIHGIFLWAGIGIYLLITGNRLLKNPFLYISALITLLLLLPSLNWTIEHSVGTYGYHSSRIHFTQLQPDSFLKELIGEMLYLNPVVYFLLVKSVWYFYRTKDRSGESRHLLLTACLSAPLIATVWIISLFNDTLPHWNGPAFAGSIPLIALYLNQKRSEKEILNPIRWAAGFLVIALVLALGILYVYPGTPGKKKFPDWGRDDVTLDMVGWRDFAKQFRETFSIENRSLFTNYWFPGGQLNFYLAQPEGMPLRVVGTAADIHHFSVLNQQQPPLKTGDTAYYIGVSNYFDPPPPEMKKYFREISKPGAILQYRNGKLARVFYVYTLIQYRGGLSRTGIIRK